MRRAAIVAGVRTPIGVFGGGLRDLSAAELGGLVLSEVGASFFGAGGGTHTGQVRVMLVPQAERASRSFEVKLVGPCHPGVGSGAPRSRHGGVDVLRR